MELSYKAIEKLPEKRRFSYSKMGGGRPFTGIIGLRGVGKTVMMRQYVKENPEERIYISTDSIEIEDLFKLVEKLRRRGIKEFMIDEIHYYRKWKQDLKKIFDFTDARVFFTSSVTVDVIKSRIDLSRRVLLNKVYPFSMREYVYFRDGKLLENAKFEDIDNVGRVKKVLPYEWMFEEYINGGLLPAYWEGENFEIFKNIMNTVVERDLPIVEKFTPDDVYRIKEMLKYIAKSRVEDTSYSNISKNVGITKYRVMKYVEALEKAFILNVIEPTGTNVKKEPKILFMPPFRKVYAKEYDKGAMREEFFVMMARMNGWKIHYLKTKRGEKTPDYLVGRGNNRYVFEVGGDKKSLKQLKGVKNANSYVLTYPGEINKNRRPLIFVGFLDNGN